MNKYQEALDGLVNVKENFVYHEGKMIQIKNIKNAKLLQELVDKATPKKPIREIWGWDCPNCGNYVAYYPKKANGTDQNDVYVFLETCPNHDCRQVIDWSNDES